MSILPKILVILSTLCYLATSSLAAAHAFPMMGKQNSPQTVLMQSSDVQAQANTDQAGGWVEAQVAAEAMSCHQTTSSIADNAAGACKAFCSAIGQALLSVTTVETSPARHSQAPCFNANSLLTRHISVDHQPPK